MVPPAGGFVCPAGSSRQTYLPPFQRRGHEEPRSKREPELEAIARWLRELPKPIGIMACHDERAQQVLEACRRAKIPVPDKGPSSESIMTSWSVRPATPALERDFQRPPSGLRGRRPAGPHDGGSGGTGTDDLIRADRRGDPAITDVVAVTDAQISRAVPVHSRARVRGDHGGRRAAGGADAARRVPTPLQEAAEAHAARIISCGSGSIG